MLNIILRYFGRQHAIPKMLQELCLQAKRFQTCHHHVNLTTFPTRSCLPEMKPEFLPGPIPSPGQNFNGRAWGHGFSPRRLKKCFPCSWNLKRATQWQTRTPTDIFKQVATSLLLEKTCTLISGPSP